MNLFRYEMLGAAGNNYSCTFCHLQFGCRCQQNQYDQAAHYQLYIRRLRESQAQSHKQISVLKAYTEAEIKALKKKEKQKREDEIMNFLNDESIK